MKKWKPTCGERFYYISQSGTISSTRAGYGEDTIFKIATGNCYKTFDQCRLALKKILDEIGLPYFSWGTIAFVKNGNVNSGILAKHIPHAPNKPKKDYNENERIFLF